MALAIHFLFAIFYPMHEQKPFQETLRVTQLRIEHRPAPPRARPQRTVVHHMHVQVHTQAVSVQLPVLAPPRHRELAKITSRALEYAPPRSPAHAQTHAMLPQVDYQATIAKLRAQNDPLLGAVRPVEHTTTQKHYASNLAESFGSSPGSEGVLTPVTSWHDDGYNYYYVRYYVQYPDGAVETGTVPWPLRYLPSSDPFALHIEHFPLPLPLPDFTLPAGTNLRPLISYCWEHRMEIDSCPIAHD